MRIDDEIHTWQLCETARNEGIDSLTAYTILTHIVPKETALAAFNGGIGAEMETLLHASGSYEQAQQHLHNNHH